MTLHHTNKSPDYVASADKVRGSNSLWAGVDGRFVVSKHGAWSVLEKLYLKEAGEGQPFKYQPIHREEFTWLEAYRVESAGNSQPVEPETYRQASYVSDRPGTTVIPQPTPVERLFINYRPEVEGVITAKFMAAEESTYSSLVDATGKHRRTVQRVLDDLEKAGWAKPLDTNSRGGRGNARRFQPTEKGRDGWAASY
ncbi:hypothetical protein NITHO_2020001 [Nitrolancea hollandica Lb]|uniref:Uncharacterized protein n=1 Tax=Nitrolancea hollandica Lb TaxID=1129897 RepID=I4EEU6_9BACT|nr:hypothetical protein NITHO_2020001 [Nitrolancea hollandica Lb]